MRLIKILGLAVTAALASMAFIGAGSASADSLCKTDVKHGGPCPSSFAVGSTVTGLTSGKTAILLNTSGEPTMTCHSKTTGKITANHAAHKGLLGLLTELSFSECSGLCPKATGHSAPFVLEAFAATLLAHVREDVKGLLPGALLEGCTFFKVNCLFQIEGTSALLKAGTDTLTADKVPLVRSGHSGLCPAKGFWDATYLVTVGGAPAFLALS